MRATPSMERYATESATQMKLSLSAAARESGKSKSTISRAIKKGKLSASKAGGGGYQIDPAELFRVFPRATPEPVLSNDTQLHEERGATMQFRMEMAERDAAREREERQREREQAEATIQDLRSRLDRAESRIAVLLPSPDGSSPRRRWWPFK